MQWKKSLTWLFLLSCFYLNCAAADNSIPLNEVKLNESKDQLAIDFIFDDPVEYHCMLLKNPARLVVDLDNVILKAKLATLSSTFFTGVRSCDHQHEYLRLVFDLSNEITLKSSFSSVNHSLTLKLSKGKTSPLPEQSSQDSSLSPPEPSLTLHDKKTPTKIVVVIDPGHGGKDPGATGLHGTKEKEVVLKIATQLQNLLNDEPGFSAVLTRSTDCYLPLRKRLAIARKHHADMFIAIHADAYNQSNAAGAAVYALSQRGATSEAAKWLAEKENESELGGLSDELADKDAILRSVLIDLSQTHTIEASLQIGNTLLGKLGKFSKLHHLRVEQAAFVVLKSPDIPSVLVETGFLSNPTEEEKLIDSAYQHQTAYLLKEGIKLYFVQNPPFDSWFSTNRHKTANVAVNEVKSSKYKKGKN